MLSVCQATQIQTIGEVNSELEHMWNEAVMDKYNVQSQPTAGANKENKNKKSQSGTPTQEYEGLLLLTCLLESVLIDLWEIRWS
jgi:hypothetical protein